MTSATDTLVYELAATWPSEFLDPQSDAGRSAQAAIDRMKEAIENGSMGSLPYFKGKVGEVLWISLGGGRGDLLRYFDDLKCWLRPYYGIGDSMTLVPHGTAGRLAQLISGVTSSGYLRWRTGSDKVHAVLETLGVMHRYLESAPSIELGLSPSLSSLQLQFVMALRIGDWVAAASFIDEIDQRQLDQAHRTMQMRIRLLDAKGAMDELFSFISHHEAWNFSNPRRIAEAIVRAIYEGVLAPLHARGLYAEGLDLFRNIWYARIADSLNQASDAVGIDNLRAYVALLENDRDAAIKLLALLPDGFSNFVQAHFPSVQASASPEDSPSESVLTGFRNGDTFWTSLRAAVRDGLQDKSRSLIDEVDSKLLSDIGFIEAAPAALLDILSDDGIEGRTSSRVLRQEVVSSVIEAVVSADGFPRLAHIDIYMALADGLIYLRGLSANDADSQLVLGLISAIVYLDPGRASRCDSIIRGWWRQRVIIQRLPWLVAALEAVAPIHPDPTALHDLVIEGLDLALRKRYCLTASETKAWKRIGNALEVPRADLDELLRQITARDAGEGADELLSAGLKRIAIVSLQESGAREASKELADRTGADVFVVTSLAQDAMTRKASTADLILFVWAASSHAVYRAFDESRKRLVYVQGTGAASIVSAAEKWARHRSSVE